jgi:hypothetical protein
MARASVEMTKADMTNPPVLPDSGDECLDRSVNIQSVKPDRVGAEDLGPVLG